MAYTISLGLEAVEDLRNLKAYVRSAVKDAIETYMRDEPTKTGRSRIKRPMASQNPGRQK